jgi:4-hydroxybenzoate polyprenyltransferase
MNGKNMKTKLTINQWLTVLVFSGICLATAYATGPQTITCQVNGSTLTLSWPTVGWVLQAQTNNLAKGLGNNWVDVAGSAASNTKVITINPANPAVFYRLRSP